MIENPAKISDKINQILLIEVDILNRIDAISKACDVIQNSIFDQSFIFKDNQNLKSNDSETLIIEHRDLESSNFDDLKIAKDEYLHRRSRESFFEELDIFGEPAWDIILDLYISRIEGRKISVSSACIASACPPTTALRWIGILEERGLIHKSRDRDDGRRAYLQIDENFAKRVKRFLIERATRRLAK